ncbi:hypothetical protein K2X33_12765, partial [bacterium]|nr:hypothetical protein [bacterium]
MAKRFIAVVFILVGCSKAPPPRLQSFAPLESRGAGTLYVFLSNFKSRAIRSVDLTAGKVLPQVLPPQPQAWLRWNPFSGTLGVLNQTGAAGFTQAKDSLEFTSQFALPAENPQDVFFLSEDEAYFTLHGSNTIERRRLSTGEILATLDVSPWKDEDGFSEPTYFLAAAGKVFVVLQTVHMQLFRPSGPGYLLPIDPQTNSFGEPLPLTLPNPFGEPRVLDGNLYIGEAGKLGLTDPKLDGGIECIDPLEESKLGIVIDEATLGGDLLSFEMLTEDSGFAIVGTPSTQLVRFE